MNILEKQINPLKDYKMIIYKIENKKNGKIYIGQSIKSFHKRYCAGKWWKPTECPRGLRQSVEKYGKENFEVSILEHSISNFGVLDSLERAYISKYNCIFPNGYNFEGGGQQYGKKVSDDTRKKQSSSGRIRYSKDHILYDRDGKEYRFSIIKDFAKKYGLNYSRLCSVCKGVVKRHRGFTADKNFPVNNKYLKPKLHILVDKNGNEYTFYNIKDFALKHNISCSHLGNVLNGKKLSAKGFMLKNPRKTMQKSWVGTKNPKSKYKTVILEKDGKQITLTDNIIKFAHSVGGVSGNLYGLINGKNKSFKGYKLVKVELI